ncbi:hypothetical protein M3J09_000526 [Ascochyta lentis]
MPYVCSTCEKAYSTASHLTRHRSTHQPDRRFKCPFCTKNFLRQDIARRHSDRCPKRQGQRMPVQRERGQPRKACDRCAYYKVQCDKDRSCSTCKKADVPCSYRRLEETKNPSTRSLTLLSEGAITPSFEEVDPKNRNSFEKDDTIGSHTTSRVPFLLSYTSTKTQTPKDFADALGTVNASKGEPDCAGTEEEKDLSMDPFHPFSMMAPLFTADLFHLDDHAESFTPTSRPLQSDYSACEEIIQGRVADMTAFFLSSKKSVSSHCQETIRTLFTSDVLLSSVDLFFRYAYRHVPIVHPSSFRIETVELPLLFSVLLVGCIWSYPSDTYFLALDVAEEIETCVFENDIFTRLRDEDGADTGAASRSALPLLQSATLLISVSFSFPDADVRRRFRTHRFSDLISVVRSLKSDRSKHHCFWTADATATINWNHYVTQESYNRVIYYIHLLDSHISTLYATFPRIPVLEMQTCLPSDETAFLAKDAGECRAQLSRTPSTQYLSLVDLLQKLMAHDWTSSIHQQLSGMTTFAMFLTVGALQSMILTAKTQLLDAHQPKHFERALARWKLIWDSSGDARGATKQTGFMVHAEELWLLAHKVLKSDPSKLILRFEVEDMSQVRRWLAELD